MLLIGAVSVGGCCLFSSAAIVLVSLAADDSPSPEGAATRAPVATGGGDSKLGGYMLSGRSTVTSEGFADSLVGNWMLMDGASVKSIESIHSDHIEVRTSSVGELWHFTFEAGGSYAFRYLITARANKVLWVEKGEWSTDGAQLTLTPESCTSKSMSETSDCLEPTARTYALTTITMDELTANERIGASWTGVRFTGPFPAFSQGPNPYSYRELQRVQ